MRLLERWLNRSYKLPYLLRCLIPIHFWHIAVHKYHRKTYLVFQPPLLDHLYSFDTVCGHVNPLSELIALELRMICQSALNDNLDGVNIVGLIIYEQKF